MTSNISVAGEYSSHTLCNIKTLHCLTVISVNFQSKNLTFYCLQLHKGEDLLLSFVTCKDKFNIVGFFTVLHIVVGQVNFNWSILSSKNCENCILSTKAPGYRRIACALGIVIGSHHDHWSPFKLSNCNLIPRSSKMYKNPPNKRAMFRQFCKHYTGVVLTWKVQAQQGCRLIKPLACSTKNVLQSS